MAAPKKFWLDKNRSSTNPFGKKSREMDLAQTRETKPKDTLKIDNKRVMPTKRGVF